MWQWIACISLVAAAGPERLATDVLSLGAPTRDGKFLTHVQHGNLAVRELASGRDRLLTQKTGGEFAYFSVPSRRATHIAYAWFNEQRFYELRLVPFSGGPHRVLFRNPEAGFVQPCAFTVDDRKVLTLLFRRDNTSQIVLIDTESGTVETLRSLNWVYPKRMDLSPDGRWIVYDSFRPDSKTERAIYVLSTDGTTERLLPPEPGSWLFPLFTPDGNSVLFTGGDADSLDLWRKPLDGGPAQRLARARGRARPLGITGAGLLLFGRRNAASDVFSLPLAAPYPLSSLARSFPGMNRGAVYSPDGRSLAYLSRRGAENYGQESRTLLVQDLKTGVERDLAPRLACLDRLHWGPAGLLISGSDGRGRAGVFRLDTDSGRLTPLYTEPAGPCRGYPAVVAASGTLYLIKQGQLWRKAPQAELEPTSMPATALASEGEQIALLHEETVTVLEEKTLMVTARHACPSCTELAWSGILLGAGPKSLVQLPGGAFPGPVAREGPISLSPGGKLLAVTLSRGNEEVWALRVRP